MRIWSSNSVTELGIFTYITKQYFHMSELLSNVFLVWVNIYVLFYHEVHDMKA